MSKPPARRLATGCGGLVPCTPLGSLMLIKSVRPDIAGLDAVVVGRSNIVGRPMAQLLPAESCTVTVAHSKTRDLPAVCRRADILVGAVGRPQMIRRDWIKPGAIVIDVGINRVPNPAHPGKTRLVGDVAFADAKEVAGAITPVPGGVGPMTIAACCTTPCRPPVCDGESLLDDELAGLMPNGSARPGRRSEIRTHQPATQACCSDAPPPASALRWRPRLLEHVARI